MHAARGDAPIKISRCPVMHVSGFMDPSRASPRAIERRWGCRGGQAGLRRGFFHRPGARVDEPRFATCAWITRRITPVAVIVKGPLSDSGRMRENRGAPESP